MNHSSTRKTYTYKYVFYSKTRGPVLSIFRAEKIQPVRKSITLLELKSRMDSTEIRGCPVDEKERYRLSNGR